MVSRQQLFKWGGFFLFALYLAILCYLLFFSGYRQAVRGIVSYNFIPFMSILAEIRGLGPFNLGMLTNNLFGNIIAFMPLGFFIPLLHPNARKLKYSILCSFALSITIELLQLVTRMGACDMDDVILNSIGGFCGYWFWILLCKTLSISKRGC
jgi:glycopeptide antibiotics resistance protein